MARFSNPKMNEYCIALFKKDRSVVVMLTLNVMANRLQPVLLSSPTGVSAYTHFMGIPTCTFRANGKARSKQPHDNEQCSL